MPVQNQHEALLSFEAHLLDETVQSLGLGLRDRKGRREEAVSMTNVHLTHLARTQHRICLFFQQGQLSSVPRAQLCLSPSPEKL